MIIFAKMGRVRMRQHLIMDSQGMEALQPEEKRESLFRRIWRYKFHYVVVLPAMAFILFFKVLPFILNCWLPFINFQPFKGLINSPWAGLDQFRRVLYNPAFRIILTNTLILKLSYILICCILSVALALALSGIRNRLARNMFSALFLLPYFIPSAVIAYILMSLSPGDPMGELGMSTSLLADEGWFRILEVMAEALKTCGIPTLLAMAAIRARETSAFASADIEGLPSLGAFRCRLISATRIALVFVLLQMSTLLSTDFELVHSLQNAFNLRASETLDTFQYKTGFMMGNISQSSALWWMQNMVQILLTFAVYLLVRRYFQQDLFPGMNEKAVSFLPESRKGSGAIGWMVTILFGSGILAGMLYLFVYPFTSHITSSGAQDILGLGPMLLYGVMYLTATFGFLFITITMAYPLTVMDLPGRKLYKGFLLVLIVIGAGKTQEFVFLNNLRMLNTIFPLIIYGSFSFGAIFILKGIFNSRYADLKAEAVRAGKGELCLFFTLFIPKLWKPIVGLGILQFTALWNSYFASFLMINDPKKTSPVTQFWYSAISRPAREVGSLADPAVLQTAAMVSIVPVVLFLVFRPLLTSETLISQLRK